MNGLTSRLTIAAAVVGLAVAFSVEAKSEEERAERACFHADMASGFSAPEEDRIYVTVSPKKVFELQMLGRCPNIDWTHRIGIRSLSGMVCTGQNVELIVPDDGGMGPHRCMVKAIRRLSEEEVAARRGR